MVNTKRVSVLKLRILPPPPSSKNLLNISTHMGSIFSVLVVKASFVFSLSSSETRVHFARRPLK